MVIFQENFCCRNGAPPYHQFQLQSATPKPWICATSGSASRSTWARHPQRVRIGAGQATSGRPRVVVYPPWSYRLAPPENHGGFEMNYVDPFRGPTKHFFFLGGGGRRWLLGSGRVSFSSCIRVYSFVESWAKPKLAQSIKRSNPAEQLPKDNLPGTLKNCLDFWRSTPQNKVFSNQNKEPHLGSR